MTQHLALRTHTTPTGAVVELSGELDHDTAPEARDMVSRLVLRPGGQLVLGLGGLTFCDSTGISILNVARNHALAADAAIALAAVPDHLDRILRNVGLDRVFANHRTSQDAEDAWQKRLRLTRQAA
ncbi:STAS domain-containing protein [Streptomyces olivaceus]